MIIIIIINMNALHVCILDHIIMHWHKVNPFFMCCQKWNLFHLAHFFFNVLYKLVTRNNNSSDRRDIIYCYVWDLWIGSIISGENLWKMRHEWRLLWGFREIFVEYKVERFWAFTKWFHKILQHSLELSFKSISKSRYSMPHISISIIRFQIHQLSFKLP